MTTLFVEGKWRDGESSKAVVSPIDAQIVGRMTLANKQDVLDAARAARRRELGLSAYERAALLLRVSDALLAQRQEFALSITAECGTALKTAYTEVDRAAEWLRGYSEQAKRLTGECITTDVVRGAARRHALTRREPIGVVLAVTPFNRPLNQVVVKLAPALAAGNVVILKPSEKTPLTAAKLVALMLECGLPAHALQLLTGDPRMILGTLLEGDWVDMLTFTGSSEVGLQLARAAGMIRTTFELGDSGALIVLADADLAGAIEAGAIGAFASAGQSCRGVKRLLIAEAVADQFVDTLAERARALRVGDPTESTTDIGTLIDEPAALRVERRVKDALDRGARLVCGNHRERAQYWPTVLDRVPPDCELVLEETFGPCAPVTRVRDLPEAIEIVNASRFGLQTGVFTRSLELAQRAADGLKVGTVIINGGPQFDSPNLPFGGVKASGIGREGLAYSVAEMTVLKTVVL